MKYHILAFGAGFLLDQIFGDPYFCHILSGESAG